MIFNTAIYSSGGGKGGIFRYSYTGSYVDTWADGVRTIKFTSSGTLTVIRGGFTAEAFLQAGGGGGARNGYHEKYANGGGGGYTALSVTPETGETYTFSIGAGGADGYVANGQSTGYGGRGGNTTAFGVTCTGGTGAQAYWEAIAGTAGSPNASGSSPNGGSGSRADGSTGGKGGNGYVTLTLFEE